MDDNPNAAITRAFRETGNRIIGVMAVMSVVQLLSIVTLIRLFGRN